MLWSLQIMDPKMDSGCVSTEELGDSDDLVVRPLLPAEVVGIIDQLLCLEVWLVSFLILGAWHSLHIVPSNLCPDGVAPWLPTVTDTRNQRICHQHPNPTASELGRGGLYAQERPCGEPTSP